MSGKTGEYGGDGGSWFSYSFGNAVKLITAFTSINASPYYDSLVGLKVTFDDGTAVNIGLTSTEYTVRDISLENDTIRLIYLKITTDDRFGGNKRGINRIYIETLQGMKWDSLNGTTTETPDSSWTLVTEDDLPLKNFYPTGIFGRAGGAVDTLGFYYETDILTSRVVQEFEYQNLAMEALEVINISSAIVSNQTGEVQTSSIRFQKSVGSSFTWEIENGLSAGVSTSFKTGFPIIAEGNVEVSVEYSFNSMFGEESSVEEEFVYEARITVSPAATIKADAIAQSSKISGAYTAKMLEFWEHAGPVTTDLSGTINGVTAYDAKVTYTNVDAAKTVRGPVAARDKKFRVHGSTARRDEAGREAAVSAAWTGAS